MTVAASVVGIAISIPIELGKRRAMSRPCRSILICRAIIAISQTPKSSWQALPGRASPAQALANFWACRYADDDFLSKHKPKKSRRWTCSRSRRAVR